MDGHRQDLRDLGHHPGAGPSRRTPPRAGDLSGPPPAYAAAAEFDPNRDEAILCALRLLRAGGAVEPHQWAGAFHGSQAILSTEISQRQIAEFGGVVRRALAGSNGDES
ncbi:alpha/beta hydrolase fold domain-containing protein [Streptosporangium saharense]|uniref:alpha/beta hydrolase fold domain-containing protein n=1 Tax=Streptosporangium saharense TaxID=1706840 RepID=UPI00331D942C